MLGKIGKSQKTFYKKIKIGYLAKITAAQASSFKMKKFCYKHRPTNNWVKIVPCGVFASDMILEENLEEATLCSKKEDIEMSLKNTGYQNSYNYCRENFLEFDLYEVEQQLKATFIDV